MTAAPRWPYILASLRRLLLQALKQGAGLFSSALTRILRKLSFIWSICRSGFVRRQLGGKGGGPTSERSERVLSVSGKESAPRQFQEIIRRDALPEENRQYTLNPNGETISFDNVAFSLYPFKGDLHNASRSSQNLAASRQAHVEAIASRSRSAYGTSSIANSQDDPEINITIDSPRSPAPRRQYSLSSPEIRYAPNQSVIRLHDLNSERQPDVTSIDIPYVAGSPPSTPLNESRHDLHHWEPHDNGEGGIIVSTLAPSLSPVPQYLENPRITPVVPEGNQRYTRRPRIPKEYTEMTIHPLTYTFEKPLPPMGWTRVVHPEGARYFFNEHERVYTDADLLDPRIFNQAMEDNVDLVIDLFYDKDKSIQTTYYYVNHSSRSIFFLDTYDATVLPAWYEIQGARTELHLGHEMEAQYWYFVQLYPSALPMSHALASELRDVVLHFIGDSMTSHTTTAPFTLDDLFKILPLTSSAENNIDQRCLGAVGLIARHLFIFARSRFLNFSGEAHARLERNFSVHGVPVYQRTWLVKISSIFLFSAPDFHLRNLQDMWVDGIMNKNVWHVSVKKMIEEWEQFVLFGTVMLNANVAFLAIQSVDTDRDPYRSPAQISSYYSIIASIGSIVLGLLLIRQNRTKSRDSVDEVQAFLTRRSHPRLGLETLAILHSLPYALLMWGMVAFMAAFAFECFEGSNVQTRTLIGTFSVAVAALILWAVVTSWEKQPEEDEPVSPEPSASQPDDDAGSSRKSLKAVTSREATDGRRLSTLLTLPVLWLRRATMDSAKTVVEHVSV